MGTKQTLSRALILSRAFELVEEEGLDRLSMRRLADRLDVAPMSLYNHIPNKDALLDDLVSEVIRGVTLSAPDGSSPRDRLQSIGRSIREAARRHPEVFRIIAVRGPSDSLLHIIEAEMTILLGMGFDRARATSALRICLGFVFGYARLETAGFFPALGESGTAVGADAGFPEVVKSSEYLAVWDPATEFEVGLDALLQGLLVSER